MRTTYPTISWINQGEIQGNDRLWKGTATGFEFRVGYQWSGEWKGHWTCIVNHSAIQTGHGPHNYLYDTAESAMEAAEKEMKRRIDEDVQSAVRVLQTYTDFDPKEVTTDD